MEKEQGKKVGEVKIGGAILHRPVKGFILPTLQKPYWTILLEDGKQIYATGDVSVEGHPPQGLSQTELEGYIDIVSWNKSQLE